MVPEATPAIPIRARVDTCPVACSWCTVVCCARRNTAARSGGFPVHDTPSWSLTSPRIPNNVGPNTNTHAEASTGL